MLLISWYKIMQTCKGLIRELSIITFMCFLTAKFEIKTKYGNYLQLIKSWLKLDNNTHVFVPYISVTNIYWLIIELVVFWNIFIHSNLFFCSLIGSVVNTRALITCSALRVVHPDYSCDRLNDWSFFFHWVKLFIFFMFGGILSHSIYNFSQTLANDFFLLCMN